MCAMTTINIWTATLIFPSLGIPTRASFSEHVLFDRCENEWSSYFLFKGIICFPQFKNKLINYSFYSNTS